MSSHTSQSEQSSNRFFLLDLLKAISIVAVVSYHSILVPRSTYEANGLLLEVIFAPLRFCVPVLLTISFLLFEHGLTKYPQKSGWNLVKKRLNRLAIPTIFWFGLMVLLKFANKNSPAEIIESILNGTIFTGAYYLLVMLQLIPLFFWVRPWLLSFSNSLAFVMFQAGIFFLIYAALTNVFGAPLISILESLDRPPFIYWFGYMALGVIIYKNFSFFQKISTSLPTYVKVGAILFVSVGLMAESRLLFLLSNGAVQPFDYTMFSCLLTVPVAVISFASIDEHKLPAPVKGAIELLSRYSLGIFCINGILSQVFLSFGSKFFRDLVFSFPEILAIKLISWILLLGLSLGLSIVLSRVGLKAMVC